jgi:hypothetical protein
MADRHESFECALDDYRPGSVLAERQNKLIVVAHELGIKWGHWTRGEYLVLCELAGVEPVEW